MNKTARKALALGQNITVIRSTGVAKINRLVKAANHLDTLRDAFAEWSEGEIYVCKKTGDYRYRFGDRSKGITSWNHIARELFGSVVDFAFAAAVFAPVEPQERPQRPQEPKASAPASGRVNIISIANAAA